MVKRRIYTSSHPENLPEWYWIHGLHDARVLNIECFEFPIDYNTFIKNRKSRDRNLMLLKIDASGALYDQSVKEIKLFNFKIITKNIELHEKTDVWWMTDRLNVKDGHYYLEIDLLDGSEDFTVEIKFDRAEVVR